MAEKPSDYTPGELTDLSASRVKVANQCGLAFEYQYVHRIPAPSENAAMMFGNVIHDGTHKWYGDDFDEDSVNRHRETSLIEIIRAEWQEKLPPKVFQALARVIVADLACEEVAQAIHLTRPELKAIRSTKAFQSSKEWIRCVEERNRLIDACSREKTLKWPKDEDPFKAYGKSLEIARQFEANWKHQPRPVAVERPFRLDLDGFSLRGRLDQLRLDPIGLGEVIVRLVDIKTGRNPLSQMEAFIQAWLYFEAVHQIKELPNPDQVVFWLARHNRGQIGRIDLERHRKLAKRILTRVARSIIMEDFTPHYGHWCERCDFRDLCEREIAMWLPGTDGFVLSPN